MTDSSEILLDRRDDIAVVRLNRPHRRNALDSSALALLLDTFAALADDDTVRALVLSTTDVVAFCAGADVAEELDDASGLARMVAFTRLYKVLDAFPVPVVAVCVGNCVGAGAELVAGSDLRVAGDNLKLAWAGSRLGVPVGPARLAPLIGVSRAKELVFTGRVVGAQEAVAIGLAHRVVPAERAEAAALEIAASIAARPAEGLRVLKRMFAELDGSAERIAYENERLLHFQAHGAGLPRR